MTTAFSDTVVRYCGCGAEAEVNTREQQRAFYSDHKDHRDIHVRQDPDYTRFCVLDVLVGMTTVAFAHESTARKWTVRPLRSGVPAADLESLSVGSRVQAEVALRMLAVVYLAGIGR
ncbi:hypothetical protein [Mycobacteroides abscessus]|uniref:hypothetical protein n=1 Tax=Mycobacteroides abscessus TaxID=36809 RepID=UPI000C269B17|nr:hypothetical protein [Mycobacteroides abscessus]